MWIATGCQELLFWEEKVMAENKIIMFQPSAELSQEKKSHTFTCTQLRESPYLIGCYF
jgi:hypothetical protein